MPSPGEVAAQKARTSLKYLAILADEELRDYRSLIERVANNEKYALVDERLSGWTADGKLLMIDRALKERGYAPPKGSPLEKFEETQ